LSRLFISHSSKDNLSAVAFKQWLGANGWPGEDATLWDAERLERAAFSPDGSRVVTASYPSMAPAGYLFTAHVWQLDPIVLMTADRRQSYVCHERLIGAQPFTDEEMQDPILRGRDDLSNPCARVGPLSFGSGS
jgi:hypothetical protein